MGLARKRLGEERQRDSAGKGMSKVMNRLSLVCVSLEPWSLPYEPNTPLTTPDCLHGLMGSKCLEKALSDFPDFVAICYFCLVGIHF